MNGQRETEITSNFPGWLMVRLRNLFGLKYFVETGTCIGYTAEMAALAFERVWTVECCEWPFSMDVREHLGKYLNVTCVQGDSREFLRELFPKLDKPTLFSLDAHWSGEEDQRPPVECPLLDELKHIDLDGRHVIVIDDWNLFGDTHREEIPFTPAAWPTKDEVLSCIHNSVATAAQCNIIAIHDAKNPVGVVYPI